MASSRSYSQYPEPQEASGPPLKKEEDNNPIMRGITLVIGATLTSNFQFLQKALWNNAKFPLLRDMPGLDKHKSIFYPVVIPLADGEASMTALEIGPQLSTPKPQDLKGRYTSVADYHAAYKSGQVTPLQVVQAILPLIKRGQSPEGQYENAWVDSHGREDLALEAAKASTERWAKGSPLGILDGVPIGIKDDLDVKGYVCHFGMKYNPNVPFFQPAEETTWPVLKLQEAGAVVVGKNNMHELGTDTSGCNISWGTPTNWNNLSYYPGGSSSGAGSSLCAGIVPIAIGTDAGGSARMPPCFNGVYGLKPSHHRTDVMQNTMCIVGPMAATAADLTIAYRLMSQPNRADPIQGRMAVSIPPSPSAKKLIGIYKDWWAFADSRVAAVCEKAVDHFVAKLGYEKVDITIPYLREAQLAHACTNITEMAEKARTRTTNPNDWLSIVNYCNKVLLPIGSQTKTGDYLKLMQLREVMMQHVAFLFKQHPGLLIVTPTSPLPGWAKNPADQKYGFSDANMTIQNMCYVFLANTTGCPAVQCPVGYIDPEVGKGQIPIGLMAMGEWGEEEQLLEWAAETEEYLNGEQGGRLQPEGWLDVLSLAKQQKGDAAQNGEEGGNGK